jgi:hypothetical protein
MKPTSLLLSAIVLSAALFAGCSSSSSSSETSGSTTTSSSSTSSGSGGASQGGAGQGGEAQGGAGQGGAAQGGAGQGGAGQGGAGGGGQEQAMVRVAHLSPDAPPVDFCVKEAAAAGFTGPVMKGLLMKDAGLAYAEVTQYLPLAAGTYTVRLVAPGQASCDKGLVPDVEGLALAGGTSYTAAAIGMLAPTGDAQAFEVTAWGDDTDVAAGKAKLRFVHASADTPNVDVGTGKGADFTAVFTDVAFGKAGDVGGKAYLETDPLSKVTLSARAHGADTDALVLDGVDLPAGVIATAFAIGNLAGDPQPLKALVCLDNQPGAGGLTTCLTLP